MRRVAGDGEAVEPDDRAFLRNRVGDLDALPGFRRAVAGDEHVAAPPHAHADLAVGQIVDVLRGVEVPDVRPDLQHVLLEQLDVLLLLAVRIAPEVAHEVREDLGGGVEQGHAALRELRDHFRIVEHAPAIDRRVRQDLLHLVDVVTDAGGPPHVGDGVLVAGVVGGEPFEDRLLEVAVVLQLAPVEPGEDARLDLALHEARARDHDVVAAVAGEELRFEHLVGVEDVVVDLDPGALLEVRDGVLGDVVGPVVDVEDLLFRGARSVRGPERDRRRHSQPVLSGHLDTLPCRGSRCAAVRRLRPV